MLKTTYRNIDTEPGHIYYEMLATNLSTASAQPVPLQYIDQSTNILVKNPSDYEFSIVRFSLDTVSLPVFIPYMDLTSSLNINPTYNIQQPTIYTITLTYTDTNFNTYVGDQVNVPWLPEIINSTAPSNTQATTTSQGYQDINTTWYYCYSYQYFILMINNAFVTAFNSLQTAYNTATGLNLPSQNPPFMSWNIDSAMATINADIGSTSGGYLTVFGNNNNFIPDPNMTINPSNYGQISIFFNSPLYNLFNSFPVYITSYGSTPNVNFPTAYDSATNSCTSSIIPIPGGNVQIIINSYGGLNVSQISTNPFSSTTTSFCQISQEYSTTPIMNPVTSIIFTSNTIPILTQALGSPFLYNGNQTFANNSNNRVIASITDFESESGNYRGFIQYSPAVYRFLDLIGSTPLSSITLQVFWSDRIGGLHPFFLCSGGSCTLKMLFKLKSLAQ